MEEKKKIKIYTSYYGKGKKLMDNNIVGISISLQVPQWFLGIQIKDLAPDWSMMKMSKEDYEVAYRKKLDGINLKHAFRHIKSVAKGKDVALLCYESLKKEDEWCHRTMLAKWFKDKHNFIIEEFVEDGEAEKDFIKEKKKKDKETLENSQGSLF